MHERAPRTYDGKPRSNARAEARSACPDLGPRRYICKHLVVPSYLRDQSPNSASTGLSSGVAVQAGPREHFDASIEADEDAALRQVPYVWRGWLDGCCISDQ